MCSFGPTTRKVNNLSLSVVLSVGYCSYLFCICFDVFIGSFLSDAVLRGMASKRLGEFFG